MITSYDHRLCRTGQFKVKKVLKLDENKPKIDWVNFFLFGLLFVVIILFLFN